MSSEALLHQDIFGTDLAHPTHLAQTEAEWSIDLDKIGKAVNKEVKKVTKKIEKEVGKQVNKLKDKATEMISDTVDDTIEKAEAKIGEVNNKIN